MAQELQMTIWEHLDELRSRLVKMAIALVVGSGISVAFTQQALALLITPLDTIPQAIQPGESLVVYFKIALIGGLCLAMPVIIYQLIQFILPGLEPNERRYLYWLVPGASFSFVAGVAFAGLIMLPAATNFLQSFMSDVIENQWTLQNYISYVTRVLFWMGVVFQLPLVIYFLAKLGLITSDQLKKYRKYAVLVIAVIAALVTPTPDPINMAIVMVPLYMLYEVGIQLAKIAGVGSTEAPTAASPAP